MSLNHLRHRQLSEAEQAEVLAVAQRSFAATHRQVGRVRAAKQAMREHATKFGWEEIVIQIAVQVIAKLITEWIKKKFQAAPTTMPIGFSQLPEEAIGDDDPDSD